MSGSRIGIGDRIIQLTAGTAAAVGTAAGLAVSALIAILDQQTRESRVSTRKAWASHCPTNGK